MTTYMQCMDEDESLINATETKLINFLGVRVAG